MQRLVPAIIAAWREAERDLAGVPFDSDDAARLTERIHVLQSAHVAAIAPNADRETVVRLLREHGLEDVVPRDGLRPATGTA
jgi:hypothetical protein